MLLTEREIIIPSVLGRNDIISILADEIFRKLEPNEVPVRLVVTRSDRHTLNCEVGYISGISGTTNFQTSSIFDFRKRSVEATNSFNAAFIVPTGIGAEIGGHAGDATAAVRMIAQACDKVILHPNVVNASDINELPTNALYVEGSVLSKLLMGTIGLQPVRSNRVLAVIDDHPDSHFTEAAINTISAARATYGLDCPRVLKLNPPIQMWAEYVGSGRAAGVVKNIDRCLGLLREQRDDFDAVAFSSVIRIPQNYHLDYFQSEGGMVNPWGGVEAMLTHAISGCLNVPTAHAPMFESRQIENLEAGIVEPRMAAEAISMSFLQCVLKGLHQSPRIVQDEQEFGRRGIMSVEDVSCLIIPDGCVGLPTLAALEQEIPVIAVKENKNLMQNDLTLLPWKPGKFFHAKNYLEAAGIINAIKAGVSIESVRRPMRATEVHADSDTPNSVIESSATVQSLKK